MYSSATDPGVEHEPHLAGVAVLVLLEHLDRLTARHPLRVPGEVADHRRHLVRRRGDDDRLGGRVRHGGRLPEPGRAQGDAQVRETIGRVRPGETAIGQRGRADGVRTAGEADTSEKRGAGDRRETRPWCALEGAPAQAGAGGRCLAHRPGPALTQASVSARCPSTRRGCGSARRGPNPRAQDWPARYVVPGRAGRPRPNVQAAPGVRRRTRLQRARRPCTRRRRRRTRVERCAAVEQVDAGLRPARSPPPRAADSAISSGDAVDHGRVDDLTPPGAPRLEQRREHAGDQQHRRRRRSRRPGSAVASAARRRGRCAAGRRRPRGRCRSWPAARGQWAVLPPAGHPAVDEPRIAAQALPGPRPRRSMTPGRAAMPLGLADQAMGDVDPGHGLEVSDTRPARRVGSSSGALSQKPAVATRDPARLGRPAPSRRISAAIR